METANNTYKLEQGDNEYIFSASIVANKLRMTCQNSSDENNKKFTRDFTIAQLNKIDDLFKIIKTPEQALDYIDKALSKQKVGITEENGKLKITFYITTNGITNEIDIPLGESSMIASNANQPLQKENIQNYDNSNIMGNVTESQNNQEYLLNSGFSQNDQDNQYYNQNIYQTNNNSFDINKFLYGNNNYDNPPVIGPVDDSTNQYYTNNWETTTNQYYQNYQIYDNNNNNQYPYITQVENDNEDLQKYFQPQNNNVNSGAYYTQTEIDPNNEGNLEDLGKTKVLPIKTTTRVLPVLGPFNNLNNVDLHKLANINSQKNNNVPFKSVSDVNKEEIPIKNLKNQQKKKNRENVQKQQNKINIEQDKTNIKTNMSKTKKSYNKKVQPEKKIKKSDSEELRNLRIQIAELEPLKKKIAEMEILRGQLTELNTLRAQVAEYNAVKGQLKEISKLRAQVESYSSQLSELNELRMKASEVDKLKLRIQELEELNHKYEEEISILKENNKGGITGMENSNVRITETENSKIRITDTENKDITSEDNQQEDEASVKGDIIQDTEELALLTKKINKSNQKLTFNLLYKATVDTDKAEAFHAKCDNAESTLVLVETDKGKRFGGYTTCSWSGDCIEKKDKDAFVFSLDKMKTYDNIPEEEAIGCYPRFGPIFLGCQIRIYDNAFTKGGTTYERGLNFDTQEDFELTDGDRVFNVKEIEVYEVIKETIE